MIYGAPPKEMKIISLLNSSLSLSSVSMTTFWLEGIFKLSRSNPSDSLKEVRPPKNKIVSYSLALAINFNVKSSCFFSSIS